VRKQNSKKGRPRKVINQGKAKLSFTGKAVTSHAGMAIVSRALDYFNVREDLTSHTNDLDVAKHHKMNSLLEQLITLRMLGGEAVSDSAMLKDPALGALFDWEDGDDLMRFSHGYGISNSAISFSPRATARLIADCPTPKSFPTAVPPMPNFLTAR
jgi:hypothetical protein